ncbi:MAG: PD-(D/E)XK nuclease family protein [Candidatus Binatia bacterium]
MEIVLGPFHPYLEDALVDEISRHKKNDPTSVLLVLVPSDALRRRVKALLAAERQLCLINVSILTFHQFSLRLSDEKGSSSGHLLGSDVLFEEAVTRVLRQRNPEMAPLFGIEEKAGGSASLWQTLRDLKDATVDPARAREAVAEGYFESGSSEKLRALFSLFDEHLSRSKRWHFRDLSDLDVEVLDRIAASPYLQTCKRIFYYGFYDLTQVQLDLFRAVASLYPATLFFPWIPGHPAYSFAQNFFERHIVSLAHSSETRDLTRERKIGPAFLPLFTEGIKRDQQPLPLSCAVFNCSGARDEVLTTAKEILRLISETGIGFNQVGVVARTLEPYIPWIQEVFATHRIPILTSAAQSLVQFPLTQAVLLLIKLGGNDFLRPNLIDLISSPFFNLPALCSDGQVPRPDLWDLLTRRLGITKGFDEWSRLQKFLDREVSLAASGEEEPASPPKAPVAQVRILWHLFLQLYDDLSRLPQEASGSEYVARWKGLLQKYLTIEKRDVTAPSPDADIRAAILEELDRLVALDRVDPTISIGDFIAIYQLVLERRTVAVTDANSAGIAVLDAMSARGLSFKVLFILGLNEGLFPRTIREDALLRDRDRRVLDGVLGYKIGEKLAGFEEEKLLFALLVASVGERLYCLYQRSDDTGRPLVPSWYLGELRRALEAAQIPCSSLPVPRGIAQKLAVEPFKSRDQLLPEELAIQLSLQSVDTASLLERFSFPMALYRRGSRAMTLLEDTGSGLSAHDGNLGPLSDYWKALRERGIAPTALERYGVCPFQFFALNILRLERLERPEELSVLAPSDRGKLAHTILKYFYDELIRNGYFTTPKAAADTGGWLDAACHKAFHEYQKDNPVGYPVSWEIFQEELRELLGVVIAADLRELAHSGYRPVAVELEARALLQGDWPVWLKDFPVHGAIDRLDYQPATNRYRIIDYKYKSGRSQSRQDKNLPLWAVRGQRLQLPFYLLMAKEFTRRHTQGVPASPFEAAFYFLAPEWRDGPFKTACLDGAIWEGGSAAKLRETVTFLVDGIRQGRFFIQPDDYCRFCEAAHFCRKNHLPSLWRAENDASAQEHLQLRKNSEF